MATQAQLRQATVADFDELFSIYMHAKVNPFLNFEVLDKEEFSSIFAELMQGNRLFVFERGQQILATCVVMRQKRRINHIATLGTLATHPDFHGQGIGTKFLQSLFATLKAEGIKRLELYVEADNPAAQKFYKKLGFEVEGILKKYFKRAYEDHYVDEYVMAMMLE